MKYTQFSQPRRLLHLTLYLAVLFAANFLAFDRFLPYTDYRGLWFFGGLAAVIVGSLIVTPYFTSPANAISYAVAAFLAIVSLPPSDEALFPLYHTISAIPIFVIFLSVLSISFKDSNQQWLQNLSTSSRVLADLLGGPRLLYSFVLIYSLYSFHSSAPKELLPIAVAGLLIVAARPIEALDAVISSIRALWLSPTSVSAYAEVSAFQTPNVVLLRRPAQDNVPLRRPLILNDPQAVTKLAITLDYVGRDEGILVRAMHLPVPDSLKNEITKIAALLPSGFSALVDDSSLVRYQELIPFFRQSPRLVGLVAPGTTIERLYFDLIHEVELEEGQLVETEISRKLVIFQIIGGITKEDVIRLKNTYGYARVEARKVGHWEDETKRFIPIKWIPLPNAPVLLAPQIDIIPDYKVVGHFPGSKYPVSLKNLDQLVTHNTAILGILGVGKSMLAIELAERLMASGVKVIAIDLTNQYAKELSAYYDQVAESIAIAQLKQIGPKGKNAYAQNVEDGGSIREFSNALYKDLESFVVSDSPYRLKIYNPNDFEVWRQDSKMYKDKASMASLTPTEITKIIAQSSLFVAQKLGMTDKARLCIVLEEAHSLVPEWSSVVADGDKEATNGTARAILQGRKFGLGCILVTQRTANVTKTILNQCNTIFALRIFDETGKDFLSNYFGIDYAALLSSLQERHAVIFGRASSCENPVLIRLNDQDKFREVFRVAFPPPPPTVAAQVSADPKTQS